MNENQGIELKTSKVITESFFTSSSKLIILLLKPIRGFILGRIFGPALYGLFTIPVPYIQILVLFSNIGFNTATLKLIPDYIQKKRQDSVERIYGSSLFLTLLLSSIWCVVLVAFAPQIAEKLAHEPSAIKPIRIYALIVPFLALNTFYGIAFLAFQRGKLRAMISVVYGLLNVALPIIVVVPTGNVNYTIAALVASEAAGTVLFVSYFHRKILVFSTRIFTDIREGITEVFGFGFLFFFASLGWNLMNSVDRLMVKYFLPVENYGFYSMAALVITALSVIASAVGSALIPTLTASVASSNTKAFNRIIDDTSRIAFIFIVPVVALIYSLVGDLFGVILPRFEPSVEVIKILVFIGLLDLFCRIGWATLVAYGKGASAAIAYIAAAVWNFFWNLVLIPRYGINGAAIATTSTFLILAVVLQAMMYRHSGTSIRIKHLLHPLVVSFVFPLLSFALLSYSHILRLIIIPPAGVIIYLIFLIRTGLIKHSDIEGATEALTPRKEVFHVGLTISALNVVERVFFRHDRS